MRKLIEDQVRFDIRSRDKVTKNLLGLQDLYNNNQGEYLFSIIPPAWI